MNYGSCAKKNVIKETMEDKVQSVAASEMKPRMNANGQGCPRGYTKGERLRSFSTMPGMCSMT